MRRAKSYSIVDHQLLHGGYLRRLSHPAMSLYLFLAVVGDQDGKSYYKDSTIMDILRIEPEAMQRARLELIAEKLISYERPYWWIKTLSTYQKIQNKSKIQSENELSEKPTNRQDAKHYLREIQRLLTQKN